MSPFKDRVIAIVRSVPQGKVVSYGQVAAYAGLPRAAREVGWVLNGMEDANSQLPWWRVVNNKGYLSIRGNQTADKTLQQKLLESDGIIVNESFELDMKEYRFSPSKEELKSFGLDEEYVLGLIAKYGM